MRKIVKPKMTLEQVKEDNREAWEYLRPCVDDFAGFLMSKSPQTGSLESAKRYVEDALDEGLLKIVLPGDGSGRYGVNIWDDENAAYCPLRLVDYPVATDGGLNGGENEYEQ